MSLEQRVGQMFMVGTPATSVSAATASQIGRYHVGNVMLTGRSYAGTRGPARVAARMQARATRAATDGVRLLVSTDQEGGKLGGPRHRRRQANGNEVWRQCAQPGKVEREEIAALGRGERVQLVDDDHAKRAEQAGGIAMRQHQRDLFRRSE